MISEESDNANEGIPVKKRKQDQKCPSQNHPFQVDPSQERIDNRQICFLCQLPRELRWMIFDLAGCITVIRSVSKSWKVLFEEWAIPANLPEIPVTHVKEETKDVIQITITLERSTAGNFARLRDLCDNPRINENAKQSLNMISLSIPVGPSYGSSRNLARLGSALSSRVKRLHIGERIKSSSREKGPNEMRFYHCELDESCAQFLLHLASSGSIAWLDCRANTISNPRDFLLGVGGSVKWIDIDYYGSCPHPEDYHAQTAGGRTEDWAGVILAMFQKGTCQMELKNRKVVLLTASELKTIVESLASTGDVSSSLQPSTKPLSQCT